ncbi:MAG TPA: serine/threonine-protein kinase [Vicinamibacterales bacterium]|nr:serine/threonine-protein kinase [Vicinamibacterales bacterium]
MSLIQEEAARQSDAPRLVGPPPRSTTPAGRAGPRHRTRAIPDDLLRDASRRLGILSLLGAMLWSVGDLLFHLALIPRDPSWRYWQSSDNIALVSALMSLALYWYTRKPDRAPNLILNVGLAHLVWTGVAVGLLLHWDPLPHEIDTAPSVSWLGVVVLMFAAIVPNAPWKIAVAGTIAVSMNPVGMLIARARGVWHFDSPMDVLVMHYQDYLIVAVATVVSYVVVGLGREVARAREMGSYQLGELLGRGGMGEVYKATHRMLARPAAIKLIRPETMGPAGSSAGQSALTRFRREATSAASLQSPHTVSLYDFGVTDDGTFYFAMELLEGMDLETLVRTHGPQPAARVVYILRQVCESLEEAHAAGLVHRDIKPANIHLGRLGLRYDFAKVLDFGLVKRQVEADVTFTQATGVGVVSGTPAYMAPETALGEDVDGRADLYALGCVAYYLLTGMLVFEGQGLQQIVRRLHDEPVPPSQRTELPIPVELDALVLSLLAREPAGRPANATELRARLDALPISAWTDEQAASWWRLHHGDSGS